MIAAGQRWTDPDKLLPDIQIAATLVNREGWGVTVAGSPGLVEMTTEQIVANYRLAEEYKRPGTG